MEKINQLIYRMTEYFSGDPKRIQHFMKVYAYSVLIAKGENVDDALLETLQAAAVVHDIGIHAAEEKYGSCSGKLQEKEGPPLARAILAEVGYSSECIERVAYLVGHHHTYDKIDGMDYQILVEADFIVNMYEDNLSKAAIQKACQSVFATNSGKKLCRDIFAIDIP